MKHSLPFHEILTRIRNAELFEAETEDGSIYLKIEEEVPFAAFAIHNGHHLREDLLKNCLLNDYERWYEEDPETHNFIASLPIVVAVNDSRYEYDLNRHPKDAIYEKAWGKEVWKEPLTEGQKETSLGKHEKFYQLVHALTDRLEKKFGAAVIFDVHSYNYQRLEKDSPVFNLGTERIDLRRYGKHVKYFLRELSKISLPNIEVRAAENEVFYGRGYLLEYINASFRNTLVLATEIKKIYCNELSGDHYPVIIELLSNKLKKAFVNTAANFTRAQTRLTIHRNNALLSSEVDKSLLSIDKKLFSLARNFEILKLINPVNIEQARREFFKSGFRINPNFIYSQLSINPFEFKRNLYHLKIEEINDVTIRMLYQAVIDSYADKVEIINSIGTGKFLYNSLRYFGEPNQRDIRNAEYILHLSSSVDGEEPENFGPEDARDYFRDIISDYGFNCRIEISRQVVSKILIINSKNTVRIRKDSRFSEKSLRALSEHEIGVHMLTTANSRLQPLNIFKLGTPLNTHTQEGLAVMSEYLSGNISIKRLQVFALRVLCIAKMLEGYDFKRCFEYLVDYGKMDEIQAFYVTARIFRGGGFTKDFLYLRGFRDIFHMYNSGQSLKNLMVGKTSIDFLNVINEMIERKIILPPKYMTHSFLKPSEPNEIIDYILKGLR